MISKIFSIRNYIMKQLMKTDKSGIMQLPDKGKVDFGEMIIKEDLFRRGIDPKMITNEKQLDNILNTPNVSPKPTPKKTGEVIDVDFGNWPEKKAHGGRTGSGLNYLLGEDDQNVRMPFGKGKLADVARRKFLQMVGAGAAGVGAAKTGLFGLLKAGKPTTTVLTSVPIKNISGMPAWFKPLVNKVINKGDDVSEGFASAERQIVHHTSLPDSKTPILVTQELDTGNVIVDIGMGKHGFAAGHHGQPVRLEYKAAEVIEPTIGKKGKVLKKGTKTKDEFWVEEAEFTGGHPENIKFEESTFEKFGEHGSNFDEVEKFATGKIKKKTAKESIKAQRAHWVPEGDMASGGRVPLGGGKLAQTLIQKIIKKYKGRIDDKLLNQMLTDDNPQRLAEVMATVDEALLMQGKGMGPETIMQTFKDSWKRKKNATGGLAGMLGE